MATPEDTEVNYDEKTIEYTEYNSDYGYKVEVPDGCEEREPEDGDW